MPKFLGCVKLHRVHKRGKEPAILFKLRDFPEPVWFPEQTVQLMEQTPYGEWDIVIEDHFWFNTKLPQLMADAATKNQVHLVKVERPIRTLTEYRNALDDAFGNAGSIDAIIGEMRTWEQSGHRRNGDKIRGWHLALAQWVRTMRERHLLIDGDVK